MLRRILIPRMMSYPVRERREELGLTQDELANRAGVSRQFILRLEAGRAPGVSVDKLMRVLDQLDLALYVGNGEAAGVAGVAGAGDTAGTVGTMGTAGSGNDGLGEPDVSDGEAKEAARLAAERRERYARAFALNQERYKGDDSLFPPGSPFLEKDKKDKEDEKGPKVGGRDAEKGPKVGGRDAEATGAANLGERGA